jgi:hypothetical protein
MYFDTLPKPDPPSVDFSTNAALGQAMTNPLLIKHDFSFAVRSITVTCDQEVVVFGASRKILYKKYTDLVNLKH